MKMLPMLAVAGLFAAGAVFAADAPVTSARPAATATPVQPDHHCRDNADQKKLAGAARKSFMKKCRSEAVKKK